MESQTADQVACIGYIAVNTEAAETRRTQEKFVLVVIILLAAGLREC